MIIKTLIPSHRKVDTDDEKSYTVFCILVYVGGRRHVLEKRYSEFEELHKKLKKTFHTPEFPPKKVLKWNQRVLEQRRLGLEVYLQRIVESGNAPKSVLRFLNISFGDSMDSLDKLSEDSGVMHQPVLAFNEDTFLHDQKGGLPDIISVGVVQGLYGSTDDIH